MTDPESRDILPRNPAEEAPIFGYQYQYPLGIMGVVVAISMAHAVDLLNEAGIEPFSLTRMGPVLRQCLAEEE